MNCREKMLMFFYGYAAGDNTSPTCRCIQRSILLVHGFTTHTTVRSHGVPRGDRVSLNGKTHLVPLRCSRSFLRPSVDPDQSLQHLYRSTPQQEEWD